MSGDGGARRGLPGAERGQHGGRGPISPTSISGPHTTDQGVFVGCESARAREWLKALGEIAATILPDDYARVIVRSWATSLDRALRGRR